MGIGKLTALLLAGIVLCMLYLGCSSGNIESPPITPESRLEAGYGHTLLGLFEFLIDRNKFTVDVIPKHGALAHYDVTPFLIDPYICPEMNCIQVELISIDPVTNIHTINATLRNPMELTGYDVRGTVFLDYEHGHEVVNFDAYTTVFGSGKFNPFIAYAKDEENRQYLPQAVHSTVYELMIPPQPDPYAIDYAVDASWPENCLEPYDITDQTQIGTLTDEDGSTCIIRCRVKDWQDPTDMHSVVVDAESISGLAQLMSYNGLYEAWECTLENQMNAQPGDYLLPVTAKANDSDFQTKDFIPVTVIDVGSGGNTVTGTVEAYMNGGPLEGIFCFTTDGETVYSDLSDNDGHYELTNVPDGGRVICFTGVGTLAQFHQINLTGTGAVVDAEMPMVFLYVTGPPEIVLDPPDVNEPEMEATISGVVDDLQDNEVVIFIVDGEEELYGVTESSTFSKIVPLHSGMNLIRLRACNAKGHVFSEWIEIEI